MLPRGIVVLHFTHVLQPEPKLGRLPGILATMVDKLQEAAPHTTTETPVCFDSFDKRFGSGYCRARISVCKQAQGFRDNCKKTCQTCSSHGPAKSAKSGASTIPPCTDSPSKAYCSARLGSCPGLSFRLSCRLTCGECLAGPRAPTAAPT